MKSNFEIKINKEIRDYTESIFFGLSLRQSIFSIIACIIACGLYFLCKDRLGTEMTSWLCMLGAAPFAAFGFIRFQGMYTEDNRSIFLDGEKSAEDHFEWKKHWGNVEEYRDKYEHPVWKKYL